MWSMSENDQAAMERNARLSDTTIEQFTKVAD